MDSVLAVTLLSANPLDFDKYWYEPRPERKGSLGGRVRGLRRASARPQAWTRGGRSPLRVEPARGEV
jgi:hypothetical protein